jgi:hypothetical protein
MTDAPDDPVDAETAPVPPEPELPDLGAQVSARGQSGAVFGAKTFDGAVYVTFSAEGPWLPLDP